MATSDRSFRATPASRNKSPSMVVPRLHLDAQAPSTLAGGRFTAFEYFANQATDRRVLQATALVGDLRQHARAVRATGGDNDLIGVGIDH